MTCFFRSSLIPTLSPQAARRRELADPFIPPNREERGSRVGRRTRGEQRAVSPKARWYG
jgi:hypothetical protein